MNEPATAKITLVKRPRTDVECKSLLAERDQLMEIAILMDKWDVHQHTEDSLTIESVEALVDGMKQAWQIMNVLTLCAMDDGEPYPKALYWLKKWENLGYKQPDPS